MPFFRKQTNLIPWGHINKYILIFWRSVGFITMGYGVCYCNYDNENLTSMFNIWRKFKVLCRGHHCFNVNDICEDHRHGNDFQVTKTWSNSILVGERWIAFIALYTVPGLELILVTRQCQIYPKLVLSFWVTFIHHLNLSHHYAMK